MGTEDDIGQLRLQRYLDKMEEMVEAMDIPEILSAAVNYTADPYSRSAPLGCTIEEIETAIAVKEKYKERLIEKKGGGTRKLLIPHPDLAVVQNKLYKWLKHIWPPFEGIRWMPEYKLYGFGYRYSQYETGGYVDYALCHKDSNWFFQFDIKNAFPSVDVEKLRKILFLRFQQRMLLEVWMEGGRYRYHPELKNKKRIQEAVDLIVELLTYDGVLPQGPPSSPFLFFLCLMEDPIIKFPSDGAVRVPRGVWPCLVEEIPEEYRISGYCDNVCISGKKRVPDWLKQLAISRFERAGFETHKIQETDIRHGSPMLCGLSIADFFDVRRITLPQKEVRRIRGMIARFRYSQEKLFARRIEGTIHALKPIYGELYNYPPQILNPLLEVGWENIIRAANK